MASCSAPSASGTPPHEVVDVQYEEVAVFSDLHLGAFPHWESETAAPPCPLTKMAILCDKLARWETETATKAKRCVVMDGDIFDLWAQPIGVEFKSVLDIETFNPATYTLVVSNAKTVELLAKLASHNFSFSEAFNKFRITLQALSVKGVDIIYVTGNHDMTVTFTDVSRALPNVKFTLCKQCVLWDNTKKKTVLEHGHVGDTFNHEMNPSDPMGLLPWGYIITKLDACFQQESKNQTFISAVKDLFKVAINPSDEQVMAVATDISARSTPGWTQWQVSVPHTGEVKTLEQLMDLFALPVPGRKAPIEGALMMGFVERRKPTLPEPSLYHKFMAKALCTLHKEEWAGCYYGECRATKVNADTGAPYVVLGHTHEPMQRGMESEGAKFFYMNDGACTYGSDCTLLRMNYSSPAMEPTVQE
ncbi:hypothetical protein Pelo_11712 [Pelomyxa schiedti]|nr:hypothetical protein Pelo_11712 [Pelomyxa schiedti]